MRIDSTFRTIKDIRGRKLGYVAQFEDLHTVTVRATKPEAQNDLHQLIQKRCWESSSVVNIVSARGHVGVFSYNLNGAVETRHVWPDGHVALSMGEETLRQAEDAFRFDVAQLTWDWTLGDCDILPTDKQSEFRSWAEWQLRYKYASKILGKLDDAARLYACDTRNPVKLFSLPATV